MSATHLSLFSGIGGFDLAAEWAGFRTILLCEKDAFCQRILADHWPGVPLHDDIHTLDGNAWRGATLLTGGFPCQPFSNAGKRHGEDDDRFLWPQMLRVIRGARPRWVVGENVAGIVNMALDRVCLDLEASGYEVAPPLVFPACAVGAWHQRQRVWIIAHANEGGRGAHEPHLSARQSDVDWRGALSDAHGVRQYEWAQRIPEGGDGARDVGTDVPDTPGVGCERAWGPRDARSGPADGGSGNVPNTDGQPARHRHNGASAVLARHARQDESERQAVQDAQSRQPQSGVGRGPDGVSNWLDGSWERDIPRLSVGTVNRGRRLRGLGNAVVPQQAYPILAVIAEYERQPRLEVPA